MKKENKYPVFHCGNCKNKSIKSKCCVHCNDSPRGWCEVSANEFDKPSFKDWCNFHLKKSESIHEGVTNF